MLIARSDTRTCAVPGDEHPRTKKVRYRNRAEEPKMPSIATFESGVRSQKEARLVGISAPNSRRRTTAGCGAIRERGRMRSLTRVLALAIVAMAMRSDPAAAQCAPTPLLSFGRLNPIHGSPEYYV